MKEDSSKGKKGIEKKDFYKYEQFENEYNCIRSLKIDLVKSIDNKENEKSLCYYFLL